MEEALWKTPAGRIAVAVLAAGVYGVVSYFLILNGLGGSGLISVVFALVQPAVISAFVAFVGDPMGRRAKSYYILSPTLLTAGMIFISAFFLQEGVVCIVMLSPIWLVSGIAGSLLLYKWRPKETDLASDLATFRVSALLAIPLVLIPVEQSIPSPVDSYTVTRSVEIEASREEVWALMQSVPAIGAKEGGWNVTQNIVGIPRPISAELVGSGVGAVRMAEWGAGITFEEHVTDWAEGERIVWDFVFPDSEAFDFTDPHLHPESDHMRIQSGGYELEEIAPGHMRLSLHTTYAARTKLNWYASLWGELFLGDIQSNILDVIRERAER